MNKSRLSIVYRAHPLVMLDRGGGWANVGRAWTDFSKTINAKYLIVSVSINGKGGAARIAARRVGGSG